MFSFSQKERRVLWWKEFIGKRSYRTAHAHSSVQGLTPCYWDTGCATFICSPGRTSIVQGFFASQELPMNCLVSLSFHPSPKSPWMLQLSIKILLLHRIFLLQQYGFFAMVFTSMKVVFRLFLKIFLRSFLFRFLRSYVITFSAPRIWFACPLTQLQNP